MGSPASEPFHFEDEGPQVKVKVAPFWMGKLEVTWAEYRPVCVRQATGASGRRDARRRGCREQADAAVRRRVVGLRQGQAAGARHDVARGRGVLPLAVGEDGQDLSPRHRGGVGIRGAGRHGHAVVVGRHARDAGRRRLVRRQQRRQAAPRRPEEAERVRPVRPARQRRRVGHRSTRTEALRAPRGAAVAGGLAGERAGAGALSARGARRRLRGRAGDAAQRRAPRLRSRVEPARSAAPAEHLVAHRRHLRRLSHRASRRRDAGAQGFPVENHAAESRTTGNSYGQWRPAALRRQRWQATTTARTPARPSTRLPGPSRDAPSSSRRRWRPVRWPPRKPASPGRGPRAATRSASA